MPKARILYTDPSTGNEIEENIRHTDEIGEAEGMTDAQIFRMEDELRKTGRYHLSNAKDGGGRCAFIIR